MEDIDCIPCDNIEFPQVWNSSIMTGQDGNISLCIQVVFILLTVNTFYNLLYLEPHLQDVMSMQVGLQRADGRLSRFMKVVSM